LTRHSMPTGVLQAKQEGSTVAGGSPLVAEARRVVLDSLTRPGLPCITCSFQAEDVVVLHMLRGQIGDSAWIRGIRAYYAAHRHANATTDDLRQAMETSSKLDLRWFFDQWLRRPGNRGRSAVARPAALSSLR